MVYLDAANKGYCPVRFDVVVYLEGMKEEVLYTTVVVEDN
jgi:hypothetical protein